MADLWAIAYDVDNVAAEAAGGVARQTVYARIRRTLADHGFSDFKQLSVYAMPNEADALVSVFRALNALSLLPERRYIRRLHVFKIDGSFNDALPIVDNRRSDPPPGGAEDGVE